MCLVVGSTRWQHGFRSGIKQPPPPLFVLSHPGLTFISLLQKKIQFGNLLGGGDTVAIKGSCCKDKQVQPGPFPGLQVAALGSHVSLAQGRSLFRTSLKVKNLVYMNKISWIEYIICVGMLRLLQQNTTDGMA